MAAPSLSTLPPELIAAIVNEIDHRQTLFNLLLCSRFYYALTLPFLYRHIQLLRHANTLRKQIVFPSAYGLTR